MQNRVLATALAAVLFFVALPAFAEQWVEKMFSEREHDFGTVARGADTVHRFEVKNIYKQDMELVDVRSSCGCTTPSLENKHLKTGDVGYVVAKFNTRTFTGLHGATLTVTVAWTDDGKRQTGEGQLRVHGNIRSDVVFEPGAVNFESIDQGAKSEQNVRVTYAGRSDWKIVDVRGVSDDLEVEMTQTQRSSGRVGYRLLVRVKGSTPAGYFREQLVLVTNDERNPRIPMLVEGRVIPEISVAPEPLMLGDVMRGNEVTKKLVVRGKKAFRILSVNCVEECFEFKTDDQPDVRHIVEVRFAAHRDVGQVAETIRIATDLGEEYDAKLTAFATVVPGSTERSDVDGSVDQGISDAIDDIDDSGAAVGADHADDAVTASDSLQQVASE